MRLRLSEYITENDYFLHADMWNTKRFPIKGKVINVGLGESNLLNIAGGLARNGETVYVYGVSGFIIHRFEQLKFSARDFGSKQGKIILVNAGAYGYDKLGAGHKLEDDYDIMDCLDIPFYEPKDLREFLDFLDIIKKKKHGIFYIRLGKDES